MSLMQTLPLSIQFFFLKKKSMQHVTCQCFAWFCGGTYFIFLMIELFVVGRLLALFVDLISRSNRWLSQLQQARKMQERGWKPRWFAKDKGTDTYRYLGGYWEARGQHNWKSCPDIFGKVPMDQMFDWDRIVAAILPSFSGSFFFNLVFFFLVFLGVKRHAIFEQLSCSLLVTGGKSGWLIGLQWKVLSSPFFFF